MLSAYYIQEVVPLGLWDRYSQLEADMVLSFARHARRFVETGALPFSAEWEAQKLQAMGLLREDLESIISASWAGTQQELQATLDAAGYKSLSHDEKIYQRGVKAGVLTPALPLAESLTLRRTLQAGYTQAYNKFNLTNSSALNSTLESFTAAIDAAAIKVSTGYSPLQGAMWEAVDKLSAQGIRAAVFADGRTMQLAPYVRMVTSSTVGRTTRQLSFDRAKAFGSDLIEISTHAGARPRCAPYQGRVFSISGTHSKYPALSSTSYGEPAGLFGINCGHFPAPFIEGLDMPKALQEIEAESSLEGKHNEQIYLESQEQRYNERQIRAWKQRAAAAEEMGVDSGKSRAKVREWQARQRQFIESTKRTRRYDREKVA